MAQTLKLTLITAFIAAFGSAAFAQTTTEGSNEATTTEERADGLSTGQIAVEEEVGKTYVESVHGDWELRCIKAPEGQKDPCQLYQLLKDQNGNSVAEINMFNMPNDDQLAAGATIVTPLETLLTRNVVLAVDGGKAKSYPFTFCTAIGCFARVGFVDEDVSAFKRGNIAKIVVIPAQAPKQKVELTVSLKGFTAAFEAVTEATKP
jgi:invasion protein IalB